VDPSRVLVGELNQYLEKIEKDKLAKRGDFTGAASNKSLASRTHKIRMNDGGGGPGDSGDSSGSDKSSGDGGKGDKNRDTNDSDESDVPQGENS